MPLGEGEAPDVAEGAERAGTDSSSAFDERALYFAELAKLDTQGDVIFGRVSMVVEDSVVEALDADLGREVLRLPLVKPEEVDSQQRRCLQDGLDDEMAGQDWSAWEMAGVLGGMDGVAEVGLG